MLFWHIATVLGLFLFTIHVYLLANPPTDPDMAELMGFVRGLADYTSKLNARLDKLEAAEKEMRSVSKPINQVN